MKPVDQHEVKYLIGLILAANGPAVIPARGNWPLHQALRELRESAATRGYRWLLDALVLRPSPDVGVRTEGADEALFHLMQDGVLRPEGTGRQAVLRTDSDALVPLRRDLMRVDAKQAVLIQRAGARWRALAATSAKNRATPRESSGSSNVASSMPNRLNVPPSIDSRATRRRLAPRKTRLSTW